MYINIYENIGNIKKYMDQMARNCYVGGIMK